jgi:hypothetical protein
MRGRSRSLSGKRRTGHPGSQSGVGGFHRGGTIQAGAQREADPVSSGRDRLESQTSPSAPLTDDSIARAASPAARSLVLSSRASTGPPMASTVASTATPIRVPPTP